MKDNLNKLEKKIGIKFNNKKILKKSLTHKSCNPKENNEKLEFLGDRVLGLVISKKLLDIYPEENEGVLDKKFAYLVNKNACWEIAKKISLNEFIYVGTSNKKNNKIENKILSDCCEALIGAIYIDSNYDKVKKFILKYWKEKITESSNTIIDPKTKLQEFSLKKFKKLPVYKVLNSSGPKHKPIFKVAVKIVNSKFFNAIGNSIKEAEQKAATLLNKSLGI